MLSYSHHCLGTGNTSRELVFAVGNFASRKLLMSPEPGCQMPLKEYLKCKEIRLEIQELTSKHKNWYLTTENDFKVKKGIQNTKNNFKRQSSTEVQIMT